MIFLLFVLSQYNVLFVGGPPGISDQLSRLHMILKPFMLRRIKKDVENELSDKVRKEDFISLSLSRHHLRVPGQKKFVGKCLVEG